MQIPYHLGMPSKKFPTARATGLIVAGAVALIIAGVVLYVAISHRPAEQAAPVTGDVTDIDLGSLASGQGPDGTPLGALDQGRVQFVDRDDPSRVEAEMIYRRINPVGGGFYELEEPQAWIYMKDGRALFIRANTGRVKMPNRTKSPESGQFVGDVVALLFSVRTADLAGKPRDPMIDAPGLVARTTAIRFDTQLLEFATDDRVSIETPDVRFEGTGVLVRGNQVLDRIEYMKVARDGRIRYRIDGRGSAEGSGPRSSSPAQEEAAIELSGWEVVQTPDLSKFAVAALNDAISGDGPVSSGAGAAEPPVDQVAQSADATPMAGGEDAEPVDAAPAVPMHPATAVAAARALQQSPQAPVKEDLYEAVFADTVRVTQRQRALSADTLFVWLRTLDNKLPESALGAAAAIRGPADETTPAQVSAAGPRLSPAAALPAALLASMQTAANWPPALFFEDEDDLVLTWSGPLSLRPIAVSPPPRELSGGNHLALRFSSKAEGGEPFVRLADDAIHARGGCEELEYLATQRDMTLTSGLGSPMVWIAAPEAGCLSGRQLRVNLATGVAEVPGAGSLATLAENDSQTAMLEGPDGLPAWLSAPEDRWFTRLIDWQRRADFLFRTADGEIRDALEWAEFRGSAFATDNAASLSGDLIRADFVDLGEQTTVLSKLSVEGRAEALARGWRQPPGVEIDLTSGGFGDGLMRADSVEVQFTPSAAAGGEVDPTYLLARGDVIVGKDDASLSAPRLEASMQRDSAGEIVVTDFEARGEADRLARFERSDGVRAAGDRIKGHAQRQSASITGSRVQVARGSSVIDTTIVELDGIAGTMNVYAPGTFTHEQPAMVGGEIGAGMVRVTATWAASMTFDDPAGILECRGDTSVVKDEPLLLDTVRGERIRIELSTDADRGNAVASVPTDSPGPADGLAEDLGDRRVLRATVFGQAYEQADGKPATVESRTYALPASPGTQRTLETISYIESAQLIADDVKGTIETPASGRAIVFDQRSPDASAESDRQPQGAAVVAGSPRGTSSFRWGQSMLFTRATGMLDLFEKVEVVHKPLDGRPFTRMTSDRLHAKLELGSQLGGGDGGGGGRLVFAEAIGSVYAESASQRLIGERVMYDARAGTAVAAAEEGGTVTLFDDRKAAPFTARRLRWDLLRDQVEVLEPAPVVAPR